MKAVTLDSIVSVIRSRRGFKTYLSEFISECKIVNVIEVPDGATNGDIIKVMFPYGKYGTNGNEVHVFGVGGNGVLVFTRDWWNAIYKPESEENDG